MELVGKSGSKTVNGNIYYALDIEVTGLLKLANPIDDFFIAPADGSDTGGFSSFDQQNGLTYKTFDEYANDLVKYIRKQSKDKPYLVLMAHNGIAHDFVIILDHLHGLGLSKHFKNVRFLDTLSLFRRLGPKSKHYSMEALRKIHSLSIAKPHNA